MIKFKKKIEIYRFILSFKEQVKQKKKQEKGFEI